MRQPAWAGPNPLLEEVQEMDRATLLTMLRDLRLWRRQAACLDTLDARHLQTQVRTIATILGQGGHDETREVRAALALGVLATPARALALLQASLLDELGDAEAGPCALAGEPGHTCGAITVDPDELLPRTDVVVHLTDRTAALAEGPVRVDGIGPVLAGWLHELLGHQRVVVRPLLNLDRICPVDSYEVPERMRRAVPEVQPYECFPWSSRTGRADLDHTEPWRADGPPGQTRIDNLKPLTRRVHRAKTFGGWHDVALLPGVVLWTSPTGWRYLCAHGQTLELGPPPDGREADVGWGPPVSVA